MSGRAWIKLAIRCLANVLVAPFLLLHWIKTCFVGADRALEGSSQWLALLPGLGGQYLRRAFLAWTIEYCHPSVVICFGTILSKADVRLEENVYIGPYCSLGSVWVERDTLIATGVHIPSGARMHGIADLTRPIREQPGKWVRVRIGSGCWIGSAAVVMADIGEGSVIGAGSVVTRPIPAMVIAGGVPARVIKTRAEAAQEISQ